MKGYAATLVEMARLRPTETVEAAHVARLAEEMRRDGLQRRPLLVEARSFAILDGHHRFRAAQQLGLARINAVLLSYDDDRLALSSWVEESFSREQVLAAALTGVLLPPKSTRHILTPALADQPVPLAELGRVATSVSAR